jgi:transposase
MYASMKDFWLSKEQLAELRAAHRLERNKPAAYKINAIILLGSGWKLREVKEALLLDDETLRSYIEKYNSGGIDELVKTQYGGRPSPLDESQHRQLTEELESKIYLTTSAVAEYVQESFGLQYSVSGMRDLLHRLGYEFKKPKLVPGHPDTQAQEIFAEQYENYMEKKGSDVEVVFVDAVHPQHNTMAAYGWIKRGQQRRLQTNSGRERLNLHGAINAETMDMTVIESSTIDKDSTLQLLDVLEKKYWSAKEIVVILDNARYHYSKEVRQWVEKSERIKLVFLPAYSPELNLIERVWKFFKKKVLYNQYYETLKDFRAAAIGFFKNIGRYTDELTSLLDGGFEGIHCT